VATFLSFWKRTFGCHYLSTIPHISDWHVALGGGGGGWGEANFRAYVVAKWTAAYNLFIYLFLKKTTIVIVV
jgi:hypothetical protein